MENIQHELLFFEIALNENYFKTLSFYYHMEIPMDYSIWMDIQEKKDNFKKEIISNCTPKNDIIYLERLQEKVLSIKCELSKDEYAEKLEESKIWDSENECYDYYKQADLIGLYDYVKNIKDELLDFLNSMKKTKLMFVDLFDPNTENYNVIMNLLIDEGYCQKETHRWVKTVKNQKYDIASLFIHLENLKYFTHKPSIDQKIEISKNTFGVDINENTFKSASRKKPPKPLTDFKFKPLENKSKPNQSVF